MTLVPGNVTRLPDAPPAEIRAAGVRHPGRWVATAVVLVLAAMLVHDLATNSNYQWGVVWTYFTSRQILTGLLRTLELTSLAMVIGVVLGTILAVMRQSPNALISGSSWLYIWFFRGTPVLVQIIFWFNVASLFPRLSLGIPFGPAFVSANANSMVTAFTAALLALGLNEAAYMAEIVRAGILSVNEGQREAAASIGMRRLMTMRRVVLPQAMRIIIPPVGNETIGMLKGTSLVSVVAMPELLYSAQLIYSRTYQTIPLLLVASIWYLLVTSVLTLGQYYVEKRFSRGVRRPPSAHPWRRLVSLAVRFHTPRGADVAARAITEKGGTVA